VTESLSIADSGETQPLSTTAPIAKTRERPARKSSSSRRTTASSARSRADPAESRCQAAKSKREAKLRAVGLKRTFDLLRKLDEAVYAACR